MLYDRGLDVAFPATVRGITAEVRRQIDTVRSAAAAAA